MFSLFIATRWHCRLKGKHLLLFSELRKVGDLENKTVLPPWNCLEVLEMQGGFFFQLTGLQFWGSEHDLCYIMIIIYMKIFNWFSICKYVWAVQSCYFAPLLPLGCEVVLRAVRRVMVSAHRLFCFSLHVWILKKACFFLLLFCPPPVTFPLISEQIQILDKLWALWRDGRQ